MTRATKGLSCKSFFFMKALIMKKKESAVARERQKREWDKVGGWEAWDMEGKGKGPGTWVEKKGATLCG